MSYSSFCIHRQFRVSISLLLGLLIAVSMVHISADRAVAEGILDYVPEDALGFVLINDLEKTSGKIQKLAKTIGIPIPAPLEYLKFSTGIQLGLDGNGNLLLAMIPGSRKGDMPEPMALVPTDDYAKFAAGVDGDASGAISNVSIAGEEVLLAKMGDYALMMNMEHRETLEVILGLEPAPVEFLEPWSEWLGKNDATVVVMPEGKKWLVQQGMEALTKQIEGGDGVSYDDPEVAAVMGQLRDVMKIYRTLLEMIGNEFQAGAVGLAIDDTNNLVLGKRFILENEISLDSHDEVIGPLTGYADEPFVVAGGMQIPQDLMEGLMKFSMDMMENAPELWQLEDMPKEEFEKLEEQVIASVKGLRFGSGIMLPGESGDPLMSNFYSFYQVDDAGALLEVYKEQIKVWNKIMSQSKSDMKMEYEVEETEIAGCPALEMSMDITAAANAGDVPQFGFMMDTMFGEGGKMRILYVVADENLLLTCIGANENIEKAIERMKQRETGLEKSELVAETAKLMPSDAVGTFYISVHGGAQWVQRMVEEMSAMAGGALVAPQFNIPEAPPIGIAVRFPEKQLSVDVIWPAALTKALVERFNPAAAQMQGGAPPQL